VDGPTVSQLQEARRAYMEAVRKLDAALRRFDESNIPIDPGPGPDPYPWTPDDVRIVLDVTAAFNELTRTRQQWDRLRGYTGHRHTAPPPLKPGPSWPSENRH
jgi:hypothetical protein